MKNTRFCTRKITAALMVVLMLFSTIIPGNLLGFTPAIQANALEYANDGLTFDFRRNALGNTESYDLASYQEYNDIRKWAFVGTNVSDTVNAYPVLSLDSCAQACSLIDEWFAVKISVPTAGKYRASMSFLGNENGAIVGVYTTPFSAEAAADIPSVITAQNKVGSIDCYTQSAAITSGNIGICNFENTGEYLVIFKVEGKNALAQNYFMYPASLTIDGTPLEYSNEKLTLDFKRNAPGNSATYDFTSYSGYSEIRRWAYVGAQITNPPSPMITSLDSCAQAQSSLGDWFAIKMSVPKAGIYRANMSFLGNTNGAIIGLYSVRLSPEGVSNIPAVMTGENKIGSIDCYAATTATLSRGIDYVSFDFAGDYLLVFKAEGKHASAANYFMYPSTFTIDGTPLEDSNQSFTYDFRRNAPGNTSSWDFRTYTQYTDVRRWTYAAHQVTDTVSTYQLTSLDSCVQVKGIKNNWFAVKISVPKEGIYRANLSFLGNSLAGIIGVYSTRFSAEALANVSNLMTEENKIGSVDCYDATSGTYTKGIDYVTFDFATDYLLMFKVEDKHPSAQYYYMYPASFKIDGTPLALENSNQKLTYDFRRNAPGNSNSWDFMTNTQYTAVRHWTYAAHQISDTVSAYPMVALDTCVQIRSLQNEWFAIKISVPKEGIYRANLNFLGNDFSGIVGVYSTRFSADALANVSNLMTAENKIGSVDCYAKNSGSLTRAVGTCSFTFPGDYLVLFKTEGKNTLAQHHYMYPASFILDGTPIPQFALGGTINGLHGQKQANVSIRRGTENVTVGRDGNAWTAALMGDYVPYQITVSVPGYIGSTLADLCPTADLSSVDFTLYGGDINSDNIINIIDIASIITSFGPQTEGQEHICDLDGNNVVNAEDIGITIENIGRRATT